MRKLICCILFLLPFLSPKAQKKDPADTARFRILLPDYWKKGNRVWQILNDRLPEICPPLKGKDLCGDDCTPMYSVHLHYSRPEIFDHTYNRISIGNSYSGDRYEILSHYRFQASLDLTTANGELLLRMILVDTSERWVHKSETFFPSSAQHVSTVPKFYPKKTPGGYELVLDERAIYMGGPTPHPNMGNPESLIRTEKRFLAPQELELLMIIDRKFRKLEH